MRMGLSGIGPTEDYTGTMFSVAVVNSGVCLMDTIKRGRYIVISVPKVKKRMRMP